jgi:phytanoyl-CoA hydroxylase
MSQINWKEDFDRDGYIFYPGFLNEEEAGDLTENVSRYIREIIPAMPADQVFYDDRDDPNSLKQIQSMFDFDPYFHKLMFGSKFEDLAATLLGNPVTGFNMQYFNKAPGVGRPTPAHQDGYYWMLEPNEGVTMWLAMDHVDEENGCVRYVQGSHKRGVRPHGASGTLGFSQTILDFPTDQDKEKEVYFCAKPGDLLVHHALTIHWADGNQSEDRTRKALGLIYFSQAARQNTADTEAYQNKIYEEWKAKGKL